MTMHDAGFLGAAWPSIIPLLSVAIMIASMKWLAHQWSAATLARTARVTARLRSSRSPRR
jgi:hypothetical protein